jgi:predicted phage tail protein
MKEHWIEIQPGGYLKKYGSHKFLVSTPAEAIKAMMLQIPGFEKAFKASEKKGIKFALVTEKREIKDLDELRMGACKTLKIIPKYKGSKNSAFAYIAAAIIIIVSIYYPPAAAALGVTAGGTAAAVGTSIAISLALGGITQLLTPQASGLSSSTDADNKASYAFGGPVNTTAQGQPVPILYGEREVGGAIISASIVSEDQQ